MNETELLNKKFSNIKSYGWVRRKYSGPGNGGMTFENLLNLRLNSQAKADYNGSEIKTRNAGKNQYICLFNLNPQSNQENLINYIRLKYVYNNPKYNYAKTFCGEATANILKNNNPRFLFRLKIDYLNEKVFFIILNKNQDVLENNIYWNFETISEKLENKMKLLALVETKCKIMNQIYYYKYENIHYYKIKSLQAFIHAIETGYIKISFNITVHKNGKKKGCVHNHGVSFKISINDLNNIYEVMCSKKDCDQGVA